MAFTSYDSIIAALSNGDGQSLMWFKAPLVTANNRWSSFWGVEGCPRAGVNPSLLVGSTCDANTKGAMTFVGPSVGKDMYILNAGAGGSVLQTIMVYDRLWHAQWSSITTGTQTFTGTTAIDTWYTDGIGNAFFMEYTGTSGTSTISASVSYTNQDGVSGQIATIPFQNLAYNNMYISFGALAAGDTGIKSVESISVPSSTAGTGIVNLVVYNTNSCVTLPYLANQYVDRDLVLQLANLPKIRPDACLSFLLFGSAASSGQTYGRLRIVQG